MNEDKITSAVKMMRKRFKSKTIDREEQQLNFIDELNTLIKNIFEDDSTDIYTTLQPDMLEKWKKQRLRRGLRKLFNIQKILMWVLLATITGFLISEALAFYAIDSVISTSTYVKAILTEICFIFLSGYRSTDKLSMIFVSMLRGAIFLLMLFVISSGILFSGAQGTADIENIASQIAVIEDQIRDKDKTIEFYRQRNWAVSVNAHEKQKEELVRKLLELKERQIKEKKGEGTTELVRYRTYGRAAFRVILLLISILITRRMMQF